MDRVMIFTLLTFLVTQWFVTFSFPGSKRFHFVYGMTLVTTQGLWIETNLNFFWNFHLELVTALVNASLLFAKFQLVDPESFHLMMFVCFVPDVIIATHSITSMVTMIIFLKEEFVKNKEKIKIAVDYFEMYGFKNLISVDGKVRCDKHGKGCKWTGHILFHTIHKDVCCDSSLDTIYPRVENIGPVISLTPK